MSESGGLFSCCLSRKARASDDDDNNGSIRATSTAHRPGVRPEQVHAQFLAMLDAMERPALGSASTASTGPFFSNDTYSRPVAQRTTETKLVTQHESPSNSAEDGLSTDHHATKSTNENIVDSTSPIPQTAEIFAPPP